MSALNLVIDRQSRRLVEFSGSVTKIPDIFQGNVIDLKITVVDPTGSVSGAVFSKVDLGSYGLRVAVGATPTGTSGGPTPLALQNSFTWDSVDKSFSGSLECNTTAIDSHIGSAASAAAYWEVNLTLAGNRITILQEAFTLKAVVDEATSTAPTPTDTYLTKAECLALFAKFINDAGQTIVVKSPGAIYGRELGVADDGSAIDNIITL